LSAYYNEIDPYAAQWLRNLIKKGLIADGEVDTRSIINVSPDDLRGFIQCHFFAGIGGWSYALRLAGWPEDRPIWTGSCPCQPFSVAGKGAGTDDPRHLWPHFHRLIAANRPPVVMGEQVAGAAGYGWLDGVRADLEREGYASRGVDIPACSVNAPHIRQRLYWVATDLADTGYMRRGNRPQSSEQKLSPSSGLGPTTVAMVHSASEGLEGHGKSGCVAEGGIRETGIVVSGEGCGTGDVADTSIIRREEREREDRQQDTGGVSKGGVDVAGTDESDMADASSQPGQQDTGSAFGDEASNGRTGRHTQQPNSHHRPSSYGEGFWDDHIWLTGSDGKSRRVKPSLPLLAHGVSNRVGRLRAYGNAIVPQVAAEVIKAFMECEA